MKYFFEYLLFLLFFYVGRLLPAMFFIELGAFLFKMLGRKSAKNKVVIKNLKIAFKDNYNGKLVDEIWANFGRSVFEVPFLKSGRVPRKFIFKNIKLFNELCEISLKKNSLQHSSLKDKYLRPPILVTSHIGNSEITARIPHELDFLCANIYRPLNNPFIDRLLLKIRSSKNLILYPKGKKGAFKMLEYVKKGGIVSFMIDQRLGNGIGINLFDTKAMSSNFFAKLAIKYNRPILFLSTHRQESDYVVEFIGPLKYEKAKTLKLTIHNLTQQVNNVLEQEIKKYPSQWLWMHDRWKK